MKKLIALALALALLTVCSLAEESPLQGGLTWGMSLEEAAAALGYPEGQVAEVDGRIYAFVQGNNCSLEMLFLEQGLCMNLYDFNREAVSFAALQEELAAQHGEPQETDFDCLIALMFALTGSQVTQEEIMEDVLASSYWALEDGTVIYLEDSSESLAACFFDSAAMLSLVAPSGSNATPA